MLLRPSKRIFCNMIWGKSISIRSQSQWVPSKVLQSFPTVNEMSLDYYMALKGA